MLSCSSVGTINLFIAAYSLLNSHLNPQGHKSKSKAIIWNINVFLFFNNNFTSNVQWWGSKTEACVWFGITSDFNILSEVRMRPKIRHILNLLITFDPILGQEDSICLLCFRCSIAQPNDITCTLWLTVSVDRTSVQIFIGPSQLVHVIAHFLVFSIESNRFLTSLHWWAQ